MKLALIIAGAGAIVVGWHDAFGVNGVFHPWVPTSAPQLPSLFMMTGAALITLGVTK